MEKMTNAMISSKASSIKADMETDMNGFWGNNKEDDTPEGMVIKKHNSVKRLEEKREKEKQEREKLHRKRSNDREKIRTSIRDKYKLKGSKYYDETNDMNNLDSDMSRNPESLHNEENEEHNKQEENESCSIQ